MLWFGGNVDPPQLGSFGGRPRGPGAARAAAKGPREHEDSAALWDQGSACGAVRKPTWRPIHQDGMMIPQRILFFWGLETANEDLSI